MTEKGLAFFCPGQGAQAVGMGVELAREFPAARRVFAEADDALGFSISALCADGPADKLMLTENAQPALLTVSAAIGRVLDEEAGLRPTIAAGHSLGEWSALVLAGVLDFAAAVLAVRQRGLFMREAMAPGEGAMTALLGIDQETAEELCAAASLGPQSLVVPANLNGGRQIVVAGHIAALERVEAAAAGQKIRASRLQVSQPFHSPLMAPARARLEEVLGELSFHASNIAVVSNVAGCAVRDAARWRVLLAEQVTSPVRWEECALVVASEAPRAIEVGPGRVLGGLMRRIQRGYPCQPTGDLAGIAKVIEEFQSAGKGASA
ncbi:MAG: ACP S-malonyltransferase [Deltaproteobacteria bacterium]